MDLIKFYKKRIEPFVAIGILLMLITMAALLYNEHQLKQEISDNCGWDGEDYRCYCQKSDVENIEYLMNDSFRDINVINVPNDIMNNWSVDNVTVVG